jgi:hypothetical protein
MWRQHLKEFGDVLYITLAYFISVYFAVSALWPPLAIHAAYAAAALALLGYFFLVIINQAEEGSLLGLCALSPFTILLIGVLWWLMRFVGLWNI